MVTHGFLLKFVSYTSISMCFYTAFQPSRSTHLQNIFFSRLCTFSQIRLDPSFCALLWWSRAAVKASGVLVECRTQFGSRHSMHTIGRGSEFWLQWIDLGPLRAILISGILDVEGYCQKYFLFFKNTQVSFPPHFFNLINPTATLKIKYIFKTKYFLFIMKETAVYYWVQLYP